LRNGRPLRYGQGVFFIRRGGAVSLVMFLLSLFISLNRLPSFSLPFCAHPRHSFPCISCPSRRGMPTE
jgi:hypothetical protein